MQPFFVSASASVCSARKVSVMVFVASSASWVLLSSVSKASSAFANFLPLPDPRCRPCPRPLPRPLPCPFSFPLESLASSVNSYPWDLSWWSLMPPFWLPLVLAVAELLKALEFLSENLKDR